MKKNIVILASLTILLFYGCASYYQKSIEFQRDFSSGSLESAKAFLEQNKKASEKKDRLLYFFDRGVVEQMLGNYQESNFYLEEAYMYLENEVSSFGNDLVGMIANPMLKPYKAEDFERVMIHYYKAINFIHLNDLDASLVEIRRINIKLNELNNQYEGKKYRYKQDAFAHNLMGIVYEAKGDINNAFIAYRNALETYDSIYSKEFDVTAPQQLKYDVLRTSKQLGFRQEYNRYKEQFQLVEESIDEDQGELVVFWLNGLGPVKGEFSLNLSTLGGNGQFTFANEQEGFNIPYSTNAHSTANQSSDFSDLKFVRMTIPKYRSRLPYYQTATILDSNLSVLSSLEKAQDIERIAYANLQDRMIREISKSIGRLAIKQAAELAAREKNEDFGAALSILNAVTEKADTRNWQTLPNSISYSRIYLDEGKHSLKMLVQNQEGSDTVQFDVDIRKGKTHFMSYHNLESSAPQY